MAKPFRKIDLPKKFCEATVNRIARIESVNSVLGVMFLMNGVVQMYTVPENVAQLLAKQLPMLNDAMHRAVTEIDVLNELVTYRVETKKIEILVAVGREFAAVVVHKIAKKRSKNKSQDS